MIGIPTQNERVREIVRCGKDPVYFMNEYVKVQHPEKGTLPFKTYAFQDDCVRDFIKHRFNIVVKSRQLGLSTVSAAYALWMALFHKDKNILVIASKLATAVNFIKKVKFALKSVPPWLLISQYRDTQQSIVFSNGSEIKAIPTSEDAGRSEALSLLVVDEAAIIRNFDEVWTGLYPTLSTGGSAILISTPKGVGGIYHKIYADAVAGVNNFNPISLPWTVHPERDEEWFVEDSKQFHGDKKRIAQEYLCDFISSGDTFLQAEQMEWIKSMIREPISKEGDARRVWVWERPMVAHKYLISADVARGDATDHSAFHVIDTNTATIVAEYKGKITPDRLGELIVEYARAYNNALVCPENNTYGFMTCAKIKELKYTRFYYKNARYAENYVPKEGEQPGFSTQANNKIQALTKLEELLRNKLLKSYSQRLVDELSTYVWNGSKAGALKGYNDDLVMSAAIGTWLLDVMYGGGVGTETLDSAMARSISVSRKSFNEVTPSLAAMRPVMTTGGRTVPRQAVQHLGNLDIGWLLK